MERILEIFLVLVYNLALVAGAAYMITVHEWSPWCLLIVLWLSASWKDKKPSITVETGK